jgi:hypothetical protein
MIKLIQKLFKNTAHWNCVALDDRDNKGYLAYHPVTYVITSAQVSLSFNINKSPSF